METASLSLLKKELQTLPQQELAELCIRLAKYKKENKELLHYLLFEAHNEEQYILAVKEELAMQFSEVNTSHAYYAKKTIRKILRGVNKHIKYSGKPQTAVELLIEFCRLMKTSGQTLRKSPQLANLYESQLKKIEANMKKLHEDIQYDYRKETDAL